MPILSKEVQAAVESFPKEFGLRAHSGRKFRIAADYYYNNGKSIQIVIEVLTNRGEWLHFCRSSVAELRREIVEL
jgi:hypothetical protein